MPRSSKQLELPLKSPHGGARRGAGRPNLSGLQAHTRRPNLNPRHPVHVTLKLQKGLPSLRTKDTFRCLREAVKVARKRGFAVAHFAILSNHLHLILEPRSQSLRSVVQSFSISFAKKINRLAKRKGAVFKDRYNLHVLKTPTETRRALAYVLTNEGKHAGNGLVNLDPFSSAWAFNDWKKLFRNRVNFEFTSWSEPFIEGWHAEILAKPRTWLLREGWMKGKVGYA